jgi:hypothetical protein
MFKALNLLNQMKLTFINMLHCRFWTQCQYRSSVNFFYQSFNTAGIRATDSTNKDTNHIYSRASLEQLSYKA